MQGITRRKALQVVAAAAACGTVRPVLSHAVSGNSVEAVLELGEKIGPTMPNDFVGLSYESAQLADSAFFSAANTGLVKEFRKLTPCGSLRLGGTLSDFTEWWDPAVREKKPWISDSAIQGMSRFEWRLTTPKVAAEKYAVITPESIRELRGFLDATGWNVIYGLNLGTGTPERAAAEGTCVARILDDKLTAFQVGNEPDLFSRRLRSYRWNCSSYWDEGQEFAKAVRRQVPNVAFTGPDSAGPGWLQPFAELAQGQPKFLSAHHYPMGPAGAPGISVEKLFAQRPAFQRYLETAQRAMKVHNLPCRITEANSCYHGGLPGVSDSFAAALWVIDFMSQSAQASVCGVNLHGGGMDGIYSPIIGDAAAGYTARPITTGMAFVNEFIGATFIESEFNSGSANAVAYVAEKSEVRLFAIVNKSSTTLRCTFQGRQGVRLKSAMLLTALNLSSTSNIEQRDISVDLNFLSVPPYSAVLARSAV